VQLTFTGESVRGVHYNPRYHELVYAMDRGGNEQTQLYRLHGLYNTDHGLGDGWVSVDLSRHANAVHSFGGYSSDGEQLAFSANRDNPSRFDVYVQKRDGEARRVAEGPGGYFGPVGWSRDEQTLLIGQLESNFNQNLFLLDVTSGKLRPLTPHKGEEQYHEPQWSADGKAVYCASTAGGKDLLGLARIDLPDGKLTYLETPAHEIEGLRISPGGNWLAWLVNVDGRSELRLRNLKTGRTVSPAEMPLGTIGGLEFSRDDSRLALVFQGPRFNADVWVWDLFRTPKPAAGEPAARLRQLTFSSRAGLPVGRFVEPELIRYKTFDDRQIPAWYYPPAPGSATGDRLPPVIVYPHGGPESQYRPTFNSLFEYFLENGYAILAPNVRGSTGYGTAYMNLDNTTKRMDSVADLAHAAYWLRDQKKGDPKRLAVFGGSYGGFMVLAQVTHYPDLWAVGVDVVGICNFVTFLEKTGAYRRAHREAEYGNLREHRAFFEKISPIHHVDKIRCPMMVIHGANDPRVPIGEAEQVVAALKKRSVPVEYLRYEDEGHGIARLKNRLDCYPKMVAFLDKYLK
jgi:dipeptidyl aminopeptidase/acylaminoacyl peptidase